jgi:hypothetical protein
MNVEESTDIVCDCLEIEVDDDALGFAGYVENTRIPR